MSITPPTFAELRQSFEDEARSKDSRLTDWSAGSSLDAVAGGGAVLADEVIGLALARFREVFFSTAEGDALTALAWDRLRLERPAAQAAAVPLTWTRSDTTSAETIPRLTRVKGEVDGETVTFEVVSDATLDVGEATIETRAVCMVEGRSGNVADGVLTEIVDSFTGSENYTVTNAERAVGGMAEATDAQFRTLIAAYWDGLIRGTVAALEAGALQVGGVEFVTVDESNARPEDGGYVSVYVGDPDARANGILTDLVEEELVNWRAAGILVIPTASEREEISVSMTIYVREGADVAGIEAAARAAVVAHSDGLAPGATWYTSQAERAALNVSADCLGASVGSPSNDQAPSAPQNAIRVSAGSLSISIVEV